MKKNTLILLWIGLLPLFLVGCGVVEGLLSDPAAGGLTSIGDAANGEALFAQPVIGASNAPGCITCHSLEPDVVIVGPSQVGVATRAETRVSGQSAEEYIRASITDPNVFVVEGFVEGMMYQNYGTDLTDREINDLVAYALTLE